MRLATPLAVVLFSLLSPRLAVPSQVPFDRLISDLDTLRAEYAVPGFAVTLVSGEHDRLTGSGGVADRDSGRPVTPDTLFRIGSITKTFNALAVLLLVEQGRLDLDRPLRAIVPDPPLDNPWADEYPVRVAHLLEHSSGLLDLTREEFDHNEPFTTLEAAFAWMGDPSAFEVRLTYGSGCP